MILGITTIPFSKQEVLSCQKLMFLLFVHGEYFSSDFDGGQGGRDRMVVGFTTTYTISAYHH